MLRVNRNFSYPYERNGFFSMPRNHATYDNRVAHNQTLNDSNNARQKRNISLLHSTVSMGGVTPWSSDTTTISVYTCRFTMS